MVQIFPRRVGIVSVPLFVLLSHDLSHLGVSVSIHGSAAFQSHVFVRFDGYVLNTFVEIDFSIKSVRLCIGA